MANKTGSYKKQLQGIMHQYRDETGIVDLDLDDVLLWAEAKGLVTRPMVDPYLKLKRDMAVAAREDYIIDENGQPVRRMHSYRITSGERQMTLWGCIEDMTPQKWRGSIGLRRRGYRAGILQCDRDNQYYNKNVNPGDPLEFDWDFNSDVAESRMPTEYPDVPPADGDS